MNYTKEIAVPDWMQRPATKRLMAVLNADSHNPAALFVGGCVRNTLLSCPVGDIDIATSLTPDEVIARLKAADIKAVPTGIEHGTVTAVIDKTAFEITTLRKDVETDGRRAVIAFTKDWAEDAQRRDFTMNTLLADSGGHIYDPTGQGLSDLEARRVVFVGEPAQRIAEDYLRILRFFRFYAYYGAGAPDEAARKACRAAAEKITTLSRERITQEFLKILALDKPTSILTLMFDNGVLKDLPSSSYKAAVLGELCAFQFQYESNDNAIMARLAVLSGLDKGQVASWAESYLILSNAQKKELDAILSIAPHLENVTEKSAKELIYHHGLSIAIQSVLIRWAYQGGTDAMLIQKMKNWIIPTFPLTGNDLKQAGIQEGPQMGRILSNIEKWWINNDFTPDHKACIQQIKAT